MSKFFYKLWSKFLCWFGEIKIFPRPMFIVHDPSYFKMTGHKILEVMDKLQLGDVILRGYDMYLDSRWIPDKAGFSHGAIYLGDNKIAHAVAAGVSETNVIEFCECDRIAICRPKKGQKAAVAKAKKFLKEKVPYDYGFQRGTSALYCFELCGECYKNLDVPTYTVKKFFGLVQRKSTFLAESFFKSPDFKCVFQYNPKFNIDFASND